MRSNAKFAQRFPAIFICLLAVLLVACGGPSTTQNPGGTPTTSDKAPANEQIFVRPIAGRADIRTADPATAGDLRSLRVVGMLYTGLVVLNNKAEVIDHLAQSHKSSEDGLTWTFTLKPNLKFSDGSPLTSEDVAYSIDRALQPDTKSGIASLYLGLIVDADKLTNGDVKTIIGTGITTPDPQTVVIKIKQKAGYFLQALSYPTSYVVNKKVIEKYGADFEKHLDEAIGGGPFKITKYERGAGTPIEFVPNEHYYGAKPQLKKVVMPIYKEADTAWRAYQADQIMLSGIPSASLEAMQGRKAEYRESLQQAISYFAMNYLTKPFDILEIRQAFALSINKDVLVESVYKGTAKPTNHIVPEGTPGFHTNLTGPGGSPSTAGDAELAKKLLLQGLEKGGYKTVADLPPITFTVSNSGSADLRNEIAAVQQMWKTVLGIDVKVDAIDGNKYFELEESNPGNPKGMQMWAGDWYADYPDPQDWLSLLFSKGAAKNSMNYGQNNSAMAADQLANQEKMALADGELDQNKRFQLYNEIEQSMVNEAAWIPRYQVMDVYALKACVAGLVDSSNLFMPPDDWAGIYISTAKPCAKTTEYQ